MVVMTHVKLKGFSPLCRVWLIMVALLKASLFPSAESEAAEWNKPESSYVLMLWVVTPGNRLESGALVWHKHVKTIR